MSNQQNKQTTESSRKNGDETTKSRDENSVNTANASTGCDIIQ
jgi:hypothetical protein